MVYITPSGPSIQAHAHSPASTMHRPFRQATIHPVAMKLVEALQSLQHETSRHDL